MDDPLILKTKILPEKRRLTLMRGTILSAIGAVVFILTGLFMPVHLLTYVGIPIFAFAIFFIKIGLGPYRILSQKELFPDELRLFPHVLEYCTSKNSRFSLPLKNISRISLVEGRQNYGIAILLKNPLVEKICIQDPYFNMAKFNSASLKQKCDLFFPFFTKKSYDKLLSQAGLQNVMHAQDANNL